MYLGLCIKAPKDFRFIEKKTKELSKNARQNLVYVIELGNERSPKIPLGASFDATFGVFN